MSQNKLIGKSQPIVQAEQQQFDTKPIIDIYQPYYVPQNKVEDKLKHFYYPLDYSCCGDAFQPNMDAVINKKKKQGKRFVQNKEIKEANKLVEYDGTYDEYTKLQENSTEMIRFKTRMARDGRQQFFQQNGNFILEKQLFQQQLSRLANISFQQNFAIKTFQKNAILSQRNNQKKNVSYQLSLNFGGLWFNKHLLQNEQQNKFEEIRPLLKQLSVISTYPVLPELSRQIQFLQNLKLNQTNVTQNTLEQIQRKIEIAKELYDKQKTKIQSLMNNILRGWKEIREIRMKTGMETVPWKLNIKQYEIQEKKTYDLGLTPCQISAKVTGKSIPECQIQERRRQVIKDQRYFLKVYINDNEVAKTDKFNLQWPSYRVPINSHLNITVYSAPYKISVQVIKSGIINHVIDTINLNLPGVNAKTITSSEQKFALISFHQNGVQVRQQKKQPGSPSGVVMYKMQWKGYGSRMPPSISKSYEEQTACTEDSQTEVAQMKHEELERLYDNQDPRFHHQLMRQKVQQQIQRGTNALLPFVNIQSSRLLLLKLRSFIPQIQKIQIPLTQEQILRREDLQSILDQQKNKTGESIQLKENTQSFFHPAAKNTIFEKQQNTVYIKQLLKKIQTLKSSSTRSGTTKMKYKIAEEIINEFIFEQMESPLVIFFKNLFTQKRKLGPQPSQKVHLMSNIDELQINVHIRSARNLPIREASTQNIKEFQAQQNKMAMLSKITGGGIFDLINRISQNFTSNGPYPPSYGGYGNQPSYPNQGYGAQQYGNSMQMYRNHGAGMFRQNATMSMAGNTFFNATLNNLNPNRQVSYNKISLQRINSAIQLRFKKVLKVTQCFEGPYPEWNQTLNFKYNLKHEGMSLEKIYCNSQKMMKIILYDYTEESKPTDAFSKIAVKKTKFYIGRIQIPFSLITTLPQISGIFKIERPLLIFSYGVKLNNLFGVLQGQEQDNRKTERPEAHSYLNLDLFTEPLTDNYFAYNADRKFIVSNEQNPLVLQKAGDWLQNLNTKRYIRLWLNTIQSKSIFICRYLCNTISPPADLGQQSLIERSARFVSLIPRKYNCKLLENTQQFHLTGSQFLTLKMGQDHGILLCNYFNNIDKQQNRPNIQSYLIIGKAFPYGKTIFVLRRNKQTNDCQIWDPFRGQSYFFNAKQYDKLCFCFKYEKKVDANKSQKDICPLIQVSCIVSKDNVYFNKQTSLSPDNIDFNLEDQDMWIPFLTQRIRNQLFDNGRIPTIQQEIQHNFYPMLTKLNKSIQQQIYNFIKEKITQARKGHMNPKFSKMSSKFEKGIGQLLIQCQNFKNDFRMTGSDSTLYDPNKRAKYQQALEYLDRKKMEIVDILQSDKKLYGFPMNFTYTTQEQIWQKIQDTQFHLDETNDVQFIICVRCFQYSCHLFSVWVFVGAIY